MKVKVNLTKEVNIEMYKHHDKDVYVQTELKGKHREHCLCFMNCKKFTPDDRENNCKIANTVFKNCVEFGITTPVWECSQYETCSEEKTSKVVWRCPQCKSHNILTEKRPNGDSYCIDCSYAEATKKFVSEE